MGLIPVFRDDEGAALGGIDFFFSRRLEIAFLQAGAEMGKILDLHTLEELEVFTTPHAKTAMMLLRPEICVVEGSALTYVIGQVE